MDPQVEALKIKAGSMIHCVNNVREAEIQLRISNSVQIPRLQLSVDVRNAQHRLGEARLLLAAQYTDLVNYVGSTFQISSFTFKIPASDAEVDAMEKFAKCLLGLCDEPAILAPGPNGVVASAPNRGVVEAGEEDKRSFRGWLKGRGDLDPAHRFVRGGMDSWEKYRCAVCCFGCHDREAQANLRSGKDNLVDASCILWFN